VNFRKKILVNVGWGALRLLKPGLWKTYHGNVGTNILVIRGANGSEEAFWRNPRRVRKGGPAAAIEALDFHVRLRVTLLSEKDGTASKGGKSPNIRKSVLNRSIYSKLMRRVNLRENKDSVKRGNYNLEAG